METPSAETAPKLRHSGLGIVSCILFVILGGWLVLLFAVGMIITTLVTQLSPVKPGSMQMGLEPWLIAVLAIITAVALGLAIAGLRQPNRKKFFPVLGCVLSVITGLSLLIISLLQMLGNLILLT